MEDPEILQEFLVESNENLARLDQEMVELERQPGNRDLLASVFRTIHTIKGTCGFLGFDRLGAIAHVTEDILSALRSGERLLDGPLTTLILESVDGIKRILQSIEAGEGEGEAFESPLLARLEQARDGKAAAVPAAPSAAAAAPEPAAAAPENASPADSAAKAPAPASAAADTTVRVDVALLDRLMNLVGELVLTRNQIVQYNATRDDSTLNAVAQRLNLITAELQEGVMKTRMQPIRIVWNKLPRVVRDLASSLGKEIALEMDGADTELDRTIIEAIKDPLTHIVRNACDHGIEEPAPRIARGKPGQGRLTLRAFHEGGQVNIEIADDGAGVDSARVRAKAVERGLLLADQSQRLSDRDAVQLLFLPGFSTAQAVTSISGRGVGLDVVRTHIERIGGTVDLASRPGQGATVRVKIPLTLAIIPGLVVCAGGERFVIPQINLHELIQLEGDAARDGIERIHSTPVFRRRDRLLPLADLCAVFGLEPRRPADQVSLVVLQSDEHRFALVVDSISDNQEIVVKPLGRQLKGLNCFAGATIMGDGRIALILDVNGLGLRAGVMQAATRNSRSNPAASETRAVKHESASLLLFRAGGFERLAVPLSRVARLEKIPLANVERAAGRMVVQYRSHVLSLVSLAEMLGAMAGEADPLEVVVYRDGDAELGLVVDEITDIVEGAVAHPRGASHAGLLGSAVVGGKVTDFLDLDAVAEWSGAAAGGSLERLQAALSSGLGESMPREALR